jgi:hypothetical protein
MILGRLLDFHNGPTHSSLHVSYGNEWSLHAVRPSNGHVTKIQRCPQLLPLLATLFWQHPGPEALPTTFFCFSFFPARTFVNYFVPNISCRYGIQKYRNPRRGLNRISFSGKKNKQTNKQTNNVVVYDVPTLVPSTYPTVNGPGQRTPSVVCKPVAATGS